MKNNGNVTAVQQPGRTLTSLERVLRTLAREPVDRALIYFWEMNCS